MSVDNVVMAWGETEEGKKAVEARDKRRWAKEKVREILDELESKGAEE